MKRIKFYYFLLCVTFSGIILFSGCATIVGGSTYNAHVIVNNSHPQAQIIHNGETRGYGDAIFKVLRKDANKFSFTIKEDGYYEQEFNYTKRTFRVGAFIGSILLWTGITTTGIPIPYGPVIDLASGAIWKPNLIENGVSQISTKNFKYLINYDAIAIKKDNIDNLNSSTLNNVDVVYLKNGNSIKGIIIEQVPNVQIKIQTSDGDFVFPFSEIEKIEKENS